MSFKTEWGRFKLGLKPVGKWLFLTLAVFGELGLLFGNTGTLVLGLLLLLVTTIWVIGKIKEAKNKKQEEKDRQRNDITNKQNLINNLNRVQWR